MSDSDTDLKGGIKVNKTKLKSVMILHGDTNKDIANLLGISEQSVSYKINEKDTEFKQGEIKLIATRYNLSPEDITDIFFS